MFMNPLKQSTWAGEDVDIIDMCSCPLECDYAARSCLLSAMLLCLWTGVPLLWVPAIGGRCKLISID